MHDANLQQQASGENRQDARTDGPTRGGDVCPERRCAVTREVKNKDDLIRFVVGPDGQIVPDLKGRLPGRGVWIGLSRRLVDEAVKRGVFQRSLKRQVVVPAELGAEIDAQLLQRVQSALSIAHKSGLVVAGFTKTEQAITRDELAAVVQASDGAADGIGKLERLADAISGEAGRPIPRIKVLNIDEMSLALGRSNVVHAAVRCGGAANALTSAAMKLECYRSGMSSLQPQQDDPKAACGTE